MKIFYFQESINLNIIQIEILLQSNIAMQFLRKFIPKLFIISGSSYLSMKNTVFMSQWPTVQQIIRGQYENKIRRYSPPQKIFDVFATVKQNGQLCMTLPDLLKAICFYNYAASVNLHFKYFIQDQKQTEGYEPKALIQLIGKKDKFQFYDYFILVRFLAFENKKIEKYFQGQIHKGKIDKQIFKKFLIEAVCADYNQFIKPSAIRLQSRQFKPNLKGFDQSVDQTVESVFKNRNSLTMSDLLRLRKHIIKELFGFEFLMFTHQDSRIDGTDFARSILKYVDSSKNRKYMNRVKQLSEQFQKIKIQMNSYVDFHYYFQTNIDQLFGQLNQRGAINTVQLFNLMNKCLTNQNKVTKDQVDILIKVLDIDNSGFVEKRQFLGVLEKLQYYTQVKSGQLTFTQVIQQDWNIIKSKAKRILQVIQE